MARPKLGQSTSDRVSRTGSIDSVASKILSQCEVFFFESHEPGRNASKLLDSTTETLLQYDALKDELLPYDVSETLRSALLTIPITHRQNARARLRRLISSNLLDAKVFDIYYALNQVSGFPNHFKLGHGELLAFDSVPSYVRNRMIRAWKGESLGHGLNAKSSSEFVQSGKEHNCLHLTVARRGFARAIAEANRKAYESVNLLRVVYGQDVPLFTLVHVRRGSHWDIGALSYGGGAVRDRNMFPVIQYTTWPSLPHGTRRKPLETRYGPHHLLDIQYSESLGSILSRYRRLMLNEHPSELESKLRNALLLIGFTWEVDLDQVKFILLITALEALLLEDSGQGNLQLRLAERVAFLIGESPARRVQLYDEMKRFYGQRSRFVHQGDFEDNVDADIAELFEIAKRVSGPS